MEDDQGSKKVGQRYNSVDPKVKSIRPLTEREELGMVPIDKKRSRIERLAEQIGLSPKEKDKRRLGHEREYYDFRF